MGVSTKAEWIYRWQRKPQAQIRLFCFPYAGGGASLYLPWATNLPDQIEVCPVQLPGREGRLLEAPFPRMHDLLAVLGPALLPYLDMPYACFGHSMGALICFEFTRYLRQHGHEMLPLHLFVSAHRAPQLPDLDPPIHNLPEKELIQKLRDLKGTPEQVLQQPELLHLLMPLLRADFALCETYSYKEEPPLSCPITAFGGLYDEEVPHDRIAAWKKQTSQRFRIRFFAGDHFYLQKNQQALLTIIAQELLNNR